MDKLPFLDIPASPLEQVQPGFENRLATGVFIKRDDLIDSPMQGNKFRKLK